MIPTRQLIRNLFCTIKPKTQQKVPQRKMIEVKVKFEGQIYKYHYPLFSKFAPNLQKSRVPLEFECGFACSCGTCPVIIENKEHFEKLQKDQPMTESEKAVILENSYDTEKTRLSCQLFVMEYFKDMTFMIQ